MKKISWPSFFIGAGAGFVVGALVLGVLVNYLVSRALAGTPASGEPLGSAIEQIRTGMAKANEEQASTSTYGHVVSIGGGSLVLAAAQSDGSMKQFTFRYDDGTTFVTVSNDAASTEIPLSSDTIAPGDGLNVFANEAIGSVANQYAVKIIKI